MRSIMSAFMLLMAVNVALTAETLRPNLVVILCDDLGYGDIGCYGNKVIPTPHIDRLAADGIRFTACYCGQPVCSPSRGALFTGRNPNRYGVRDWIPPKSGIHLPKREVTLPTLLKRNGYRTALCGKWHLNSVMDGTEPTPGDHGFDHWFATQNNAAPNHQNPKNFIRNGKDVGALTGNASTIVVDEAISFLKSAADKPFALFVTFHAPHEPVAVPTGATDPFAAEPDSKKRVYQASIALIDREVGRLTAFLAEQKAAESTLVFFSSDNGPETLLRYKSADHSFGSPGPLRGMKLHLTEGGIRVPGIVRWTGKIKPNQVADEPIGFVDLLPTMCGLAGINPPGDRFMDGTDIRELLLNGKPPVRPVPLYWHYDRAIGDSDVIWTTAIRQGDYKLLMDKTKEKFALYDLKKDPSEKVDLSAEEDQQKRLVAMKATLLNMHNGVNAGAIVRP